MPKELWDIIWVVVGTIGTGLATWLTAFVVGLINQKIKDKKIAKYASDIFQIVMGAVQAVFQTFVDTMKKAGKWDAEAAKEAKKLAHDIIVSQLTPELIQYIKDNFGDVEAYINTQIEAMIYQLKK